MMENFASSLQKRKRETQKIKIKPRDAKRRARVVDMTIRGGGNPKDGAEQWAKNAHTFLEDRFKKILKDPPDGRRVPIPITRIGLPEGLLQNKDHDQLGIMITDCGYETPRRLLRDSEAMNRRAAHQMDTRTVVWMMGKDEYGRSASIFVEGVSPYFYVGVAMQDVAEAEKMAKTYADWLYCELVDKTMGSAKIADYWARNQNKVVSVTAVKRGWFYGYKPDPKTDKKDPNWKADGKEKPGPMSGSSCTYQASDWYLKVVATAPYHVNKLRELSYQWSLRMERDFSSKPVGKRWVIPVTWSATAPELPGEPGLPTKLCIFEANVEFAMRFMIDRGLIGAGFCAIDLKAGPDKGILRVLGPDDKSGKKRTSSSLEITVDAALFEQAEDARSKSLEDDTDVYDAMRHVLKDSPLRFVAREASLQRFVDGSNPETDPMNPWFEKLRKFMAPMRLVSFDIECLDPKGLFPDATKPEDPVIGICAYLYRSDRVDAWNIRRDAQKKYKIADKLLATFQRIDRRTAHLSSDYEKNHEPLPEGDSVELLFGLEKSTQRLRKAEECMLKAAETLKKLQYDGLAGMDCTLKKWPPPLDVLALGLGTRDDQPDGDMDGYPVQVLSFDSERELMLAWTALIQVWDPDVLMGYNSVSFDMAYLFERARTLGIEHVCWKQGRFLDKLCPFREVGGFKKKPVAPVYDSRGFLDKEATERLRKKGIEMVADLHGRIQLDIMKCRQADVTFKPRSYKLDAVARELINEGKTGFKVKDIPKKFLGSDADRAEMDEYCLADAVLPIKMAMHKSDLVQLIQMARVCGVPIKFITDKGQQVRVFGQILRKTRERGMVVPWMRRDQLFGMGGDGDDDKRKRTKGYEGAIVIDPKAGYYTIQKHGATAVMDYKSLYPSCMMRDNLCYTTVVTDLRARSLCVDAHRRLAKKHDVWVRKPLGEQGGGRPHFRGGILSRAWEKLAGWKMAPVHGDDKPEKNPPFVQGTVRKGILPEIEEYLMKSRGRAKKQMAQYAYGSLMWNNYNGEQNAIKIACNSVYGVTGATLGRQPNLEVSGAITAYGREALLFAKYVAEELDVNGAPLNKTKKGDHEVIYGDTDSIMVLMHDCCSHTTTEPGQPLQPEDYVCLKRAFEIGEKICALVNKLLETVHVLDLENLFAPYLLLKKKKYAALRWVHWKAPIGKKVRGIESIRRDNPRMVGALCGVFNDLILGCRDDPDDPETDPKKKKKIAVVPQMELGMELLRECHRRVLTDKLPIQAYVITQALRRPPEEYKVKMPHVNLAVRMAKRDPGGAPKPGERIPYVIVTADSLEEATKDHVAIKKLYQRSEEPEWVVENNLKIDTVWYAVNRFESAFLRMLSPIVSAHILNEPIDEAKLRQNKTPHKGDLAFNLAVDKRQSRAEKLVWRTVFCENYQGRKVRIKHRDSDTIVMAFKGLSGKKKRKVMVVKPKEFKRSEAIEDTEEDRPNETSLCIEEEEDMAKEESEDVKKLMETLLDDMLKTAKKTLLGRDEVKHRQKMNVFRRKQTQLTSFFIPSFS